MLNAERQRAETLDGIREDHRNRYRWAGGVLAKRLGADALVLDCGAGVGYGSFILASLCGLRAVAVEIDEKSVEHGRRFFAHRAITWIVGDVCDWADLGQRGAVAFEVIEHLAEPERLLRALGAATEMLIGSVPNQDLVPFDEKLHGWLPGSSPGTVRRRHYRHYRPAEIAGLLAASGWKTVFLGGQQGKRGAGAAIAARVGRTLVFAAERARP